VFPKAERFISDRIVALECLAEGYTHRVPPSTEAAQECLRTCIALQIEEEMEGRRDEVHMERIKMQLEQVIQQVTLPINERYIYPVLRRCCNQDCQKPETRPDQYHRTLSGGVLRFCSEECFEAFRLHARTNNFFGEDSRCAGGALPDALLMRCLLFIPERPGWFRLAMTCRRTWCPPAAAARPASRRTKLQQQGR
jgi:hypothetical protein